MRRTSLSVEPFDGLRSIANEDERRYAASLLSNDRVVQAAYLQAAADEDLNNEAEARANAIETISRAEAETSRDLGTRVDELRERIGRLIDVAAVQLTPAVLSLADYIQSLVKFLGAGPGSTPVPNQPERNVGSLVDSVRGPASHLVGALPGGRQLLDQFGGGGGNQQITIYSTITNPQGVEDIERALAEAAGSALISTVRR